MNDPIQAFVEERKKRIDSNRRSTSIGVGDQQPVGDQEDPRGKYAACAFHGTIDRVGVEPLLGTLPEYCDDHYAGKDDHRAEHTHCLQSLL